MEGQQFTPADYAQELMNKYGVQKSLDIIDEIINFQCIDATAGLKCEDTGFVNDEKKYLLETREIIEDSLWIPAGLPSTP